MDFTLPPDEDPADAWKKPKDLNDCNQFKAHPELDKPKVDPKLMFHSEGNPHALVKQVCFRFAELGFDPDMIHSPNQFSWLFWRQHKCLVIIRALMPNGSHEVVTHKFIDA